MQEFVVGILVIIAVFIVGYVWGGQLLLPHIILDVNTTGIQP